MDVQIKKPTSAVALWLSTEQTPVSDVQKKLRIYPPEASQILPDTSRVRTE